MTLLERSQIGQVLDELANQQALLNQSDPDAVPDAGMPVNMSKLEGADALLVGTVGIAKGSTKAVTRNRKGRVDELAASVILQGHLDSLGRGKGWAA